MCNATHSTPNHTHTYQKLVGLTEDRQMKCDVLQSAHLQRWVACGLWHHYCPSHLEAPGMVWVVECTSPYLCVRVCVRLCVWKAE